MTEARKSPIEIYENVRLRNRSITTQGQDWLISKVKEQDQEIALLEEDNEFLNGRVRQLTDFDYAVERERLTSDIRRLETRAEKAGADLAWAEDDAKESKARVKELEQEFLWATDACEKAENLLAEKEKRE